MNILGVYVITLQSILYLEMEQCKLPIFMNENALSAEFKDNGLVKLHSFSSRNPLQNRVHEYSTQYKAVS